MLMHRIQFHSICCQSKVGYWLCDKDRKQILRCFMLPRGVLVNAGGDTEAD